MGLQVLNKAPGQKGEKRMGGEGSGGARGNGEGQPPPGFSPFLSPEHIDLHLPAFGTQASPWPWRGLLRVRGAGPVWGGGRRTPPIQKPLTREEDARQW